jgi:hypothetical protein
MKKIFMLATATFLFTGAAFAQEGGKKCAKGKECCQKGSKDKEACKKDGKGKDCNMSGAKKADTKKPVEAKKS